MKRSELSMAHHASEKQAAAAWPPWQCPWHGTLLNSEREALACQGHVFPLVGSIPRFARDARYASSFGLQWTTFRRTQLDSYTRTAITTERARRCLGEALWRDLRDRQVLECGCGAGRFTEVLLRRGARVTSIDLSNAVHANAANFPINHSHRVAQADIMQLPFPPKSFDVVFCLGVIQHTSDPDETIQALYEHVRPGGWLVIDHYRPTFGRWTKFAALLRLRYRRLSPAKAMRGVRRLVHLWFPLHKKVRRRYVLQVLLSRVSPIFVYFHAYPELPDELQREWAVLDTYDSLTAWHQHVRTARRIRRTLLELGMTDVCVSKGGNGVEARGRRPASATSY